MNSTKITALNGPARNGCLGVVMVVLVVLVMVLYIKYIHGITWMCIDVMIHFNNDELNFCDISNSKNGFNVMTIV